MNAPKRSWLTTVWLLICASAISACGPTLQRTPPTKAPDPIKIPSPPVKPEPVPSGTYFTKVCDFNLTLRQRLKLTTPMPEVCTTGPNTSASE